MQELTFAEVEMVSGGQRPGGGDLVYAAGYYTGKAFIATSYGLAAIAGFIAVIGFLSD